jgi:hypothetical protein
MIYENGEEGHEELLIYHPEQIEPGEEEWFAILFDYLF